MPRGCVFTSYEEIPGKLTKEVGCDKHASKHVIIEYIVHGETRGDALTSESKNIYKQPPGKMDTFDNRTGKGGTKKASVCFDGPLIENS